MRNLALLLVLGWSLGWLVARSAILAPVRSLVWRVDQATMEWHELTTRTGRAAGAALHYVAAFLTGVFHCSACSGFWIGLGLAAWGADAGLASPLPFFAHGLVTMGANALADAMLAGALGLAALGETDDG